jgi:hypothetical protein
MVHLLRALDENVGGNSSSAPVPASKKEVSGLKVYSDGQMSEVTMVAGLAGVKLDVIQVTDEIRNEKAHMKMNITGRYPLLETAEGAISGIVPICNYISRVSGKLNGGND